MKHTASPAAYPPAPSLVRYPAPVLRRRSETVTDFNLDLRAFCTRMFAVMEVERGVGLAAPQVGVSRRIFITDHGRRNPDQVPDPRIWINPVIEAPVGRTTYEEGCLSFPGIYAKVERHDRFVIKWQDLDGILHREQLDVSAGDFLGIVVQHELDHLDGIVFVDHLAPAQLVLARKRLRDLEDDYHTATGKRGTPLRR